MKRDNSPALGWKYLHHSDGLHEVIALGHDALTQEPNVVYRSMVSGGVLVCPLSTWLDKVVVEGEEVEVFRRMPRNTFIGEYKGPLFDELKVKVYQEHDNIATDALKSHIHRSLRNPSAPQIAESVRVAMELNMRKTMPLKRAEASSTIAKFDSTAPST